MFSIKGRKFKVKDAEIWGVIARGESRPSSTLQWGINVEALAEEFSGELWEPRAYSEGLTIGLSDWKELSGRQITIDHNRTDVTSGGYMYVFEHTPIREATITIAERIGTAFAFCWSGTCDLFHGDDFWSDLPLLIEAQIRFRGIEVVDEPDPDRARQMVLHHLALDDFVQGQARMRGSGEGRFFSTLFAPRPA
jgi:hypothetical protein